MALGATALVSQRQGNLFVLGATEVNVAGADFQSYMSLPATFGDCKIYELSLIITGRGAGPTNTALTQQGVSATLFDAAGTYIDELGSTPFIETSAVNVRGTIKLEVVRLWRQTERISWEFRDMETATTTGDVQVLVLVMRLRDVGAVA